MVSQRSPAILQLQMHNIRQDLNEHADQMVETARKQFDWRRYAASRPWLALGGAAAVGYFLVPRRTCCAGVDAKTVKETVDKVVRAAQPPSQSTVSGIVGGLMTALAATLVREGVAFLSQHARSWFESAAGPSQGDQRDSGNGRSYAEPNL